MKNLPTRIAVKLAGRAVNLNVRKVAKAFDQSHDPEHSLETYREAYGRVFFRGLSWIERCRFGSLAGFIAACSDEELQDALNTVSRAVKSGSVPFVSDQ
jgi:hypothetical protein